MTTFLPSRRLGGLLSLLCALGAGAAQAQDAPPTASRITGVTLYPGSANVERTARVAAGWIDASELPQPEYVEEEAFEEEAEAEGDEDAVAADADADVDADAEAASGDLDDQSRDM